MIINNLRRLLEERNITAYALSKMAGITPGNVKEIVDNQLVVPRAKAIQGICKSLHINVDDLLKFVPNRVDTRTNKSMNKSRLTQNYLSNSNYNIIQVMRSNQEREMMIY